MASHVLENEALIEDWVKADPRLLNTDMMIIGQQVRTAHGKFIDLLGMDGDGNVVIIELKKHRTPRDVVAQALDYASWVRTLTTPQVYEVASYLHGDQLAPRFAEHFDKPIPETLNANHSIFIVAGELDAASRRIVEYLSEEHGVSINTAFFSVFEQGEKRFLTTDFLLDQAEVESRSETRTKPPWSGHYFANAGLRSGDRSWRDMRAYGFLSAGGGAFYSKRLQQLSEGDTVFAYQKGEGYIGYGVVRSASQKASEFEIPGGGLLFEQDLDAPGLRREGEPEEMQEHVVGVDWVSTVDRSDAKWFKGAFANQNIVCKLRDPATIDFLIREFGLSA